MEFYLALRLSAMCQVEVLRVWGTQVCEFLFKKQTIT